MRREGKEWSVTYDAVKSKARQGREGAHRLSRAVELEKRGLTEVVGSGCVGDGWRR
jgi:hypothetical protein